jgi:hypothetical protein
MLRGNVEIDRRIYSVGLFRSKLLTEMTRCPTQTIKAINSAVPYLKLANSSVKIMGPPCTFYSASSKKYFVPRSIVYGRVRNEKKIFSLGTQKFQVKHNWGKIL